MNFIVNNYNIMFLYLISIGCRIVYDTIHFQDITIPEIALYCNNHEVEISKPFPGIHRLMFLANETPIEYVALAKNNNLVIIKEFDIPPLENAGASLSIVPAAEEHNGYYLVLNGVKMCGHGPLTHISACGSNLQYTREAIWYIKKYARGYHISRGGMCITKIRDEIGYKSSQYYPTVLRPCTSSFRDQEFLIDHIYNFYE